jgi:hypothetical protein
LGSGASATAVIRNLAQKMAKGLAANATNPLFSMVGRARFELATNGLKVHSKIPSNQQAELESVPQKRCFLQP